MQAGPCLCHFPGNALAPPAALSPADLGGGGSSPASGGPVDRALLEDLAAASRFLSLQGVVDAFGHVSMRHPDAPDRFFMSRALAPALVGADDIQEFDLNCLTCQGDQRASFLERFIHGEIYRARADVMSVVHSHSPSVIPFGLVETPMRAMFHNAAFLAAGVPVFDIAETFGATDMLVGNCEKGKALVGVLADRPVVMMRAHGSVAVGPDLQSAVFRAVYTEVNARIQHQATAYGGPIAALSPEEGQLADKVNFKAGHRAWDLWRKTAGQ
ncbi:MAG: class II aldolase/adducin family protein [Alphaproteobacteria bacterium]|nr:MAG: class II aldolase/adducin family protein [Alphaproteobacteria bacterium]